MAFKFVAADKASARTVWRSHFENRKDTPPGPAAAVRVEATGADMSHIYLMDEIGFWGVTAKAFTEALASIKTPNVTVHVSSPGGDAFEGIAMYNAIKSHAARFTVIVEGLAASAASFLILSADEVQMHESAMFMIHRAWTFALGNTIDFADASKTLAKLDGQIAGIYSSKTGKTIDDMLAAMTGEADGTWYTGAEAKEAGFVNVLIDNKAADEAKASAARVAMARKRLQLAA